MSLLYVIDGYNIIHHPTFTPRAAPKAKRHRPALLEFIHRHKLCGSPRNKITVVFDGYPDQSFDKTDSAAEIVFSRGQTADEKIKRIVESSGNPRNIIVVSDDKEIRLFVRALGARVMGVEEFIPAREKKTKDEGDPMKPELTYTQMDKINQELSKVWLNNK